MLPNKVIIIIAGLFVLFLPFISEYSFLDDIFLTSTLFVPLVVFLLWKTGAPAMKLDRTDVFFVLYLIYGLMNLLVRGGNINPLLIFKWASAFILYFYVKLTGSTGQRLLVHAFILGGVAQALYGILQSEHFFDTNHPLFELTGSFPNPGPYGGYLAICGVLCLYTLHSEKNRPKIKNILLIAALVIFGYALWLSDSRAGWIAFGIPAGWMLFQRSKMLRRHKMRIYPLLILVSGISLFLLYQYRPGSADARLNIWRVCGTLIAEKPLFGHGPGSFPGKYMPAQAEYLVQHPEYTESLPGSDNMFAFNEFIHLACEQGIVGLLLLGTLLIPLFFHRLPRKGVVQNGRYGLLALLLFACFSYPAHEYPLFLFFPFFLGITSHQTTVFSVSWQKPVLKTMLPFASILWLVVTLYCWQNYAHFNRLVNQYRQTDDPAMDAELFRLYPAVRNIPELTIPYAKALFRHGNYSEAIPVLEQSFAHFSSAQTLIDLGDAYFETNNIVQAEQCFSDAARMCPLLITPKYKLFLLYRSTNQDQKALLCAEEISRMKVKVVNSLTIRIKSAVREFLAEYPIQN